MEWNGKHKHYTFFHTSNTICCVLTVTGGNSNIPKINLKFKDKNLHIYERSITINVALTTVPNALV